MWPDLEDSPGEPGVVLVVLPAEQVPHPEVVDDVRGDGGGVLGGGGGGGRPPNDVWKGEDCFFLWMVLGRGTGHSMGKELWLPHLL